MTMWTESWNGIVCLCCDGIPDNQDKWLEQDADFVQCFIKPSDTQAAGWLLKHGFFFADRRLDVRVKVRHIEERTRYRFQVGNEPPFRDGLQRKKVYGLLCEAFTHDRRFHLRQHYDSQLAAEILAAYYHFVLDSEMEQILCRYKDEIIGCMYLQRTKEGYFVYLAAVLPAYQGTGAAAELYQEAAAFCKRQEGIILSGRISSSNTGVMNLYAQLGGTFHGETDVYMYEKKG